MLTYGIPRHILEDNIKMNLKHKMASIAFICLRINTSGTLL